MALCGGIVLEEALDLSSDRILNEWIVFETLVNSSSSCLSFLFVFHFSYLLFLTSFLFPYHFPSLYVATVLVNVMVGILLQNKILKKSTLLLCALTRTIMECECAWLTSEVTAKLWVVSREIKSKSVRGKRARDTGFVPHGMISDLSHTATAMVFLSCSLWGTNFR